MGDRTAIRFVKNIPNYGEYISVAFFAHWGGTMIVDDAKDFVKQLIKDNPNNSQMWPLDRREPQAVMINFITYSLKDEMPIMGSYYLGRDYKDGDCSDNGCYDIDTDTGEILRHIEYDYDDKRYVAVPLSISEDIEWYEWKKLLKSLPEYKDLAH